LICNDLDLSCHRKDKEKKKNKWVSQKVILNITLRSLSVGAEYFPPDNIEICFIAFTDAIGRKIFRPYIKYLQEWVESVSLNPK